MNNCLLLVDLQNDYFPGGEMELVSDAEITNTRSIELHKQLGFEETERIVCFLKKF